MAQYGGTWCGTFHGKKNHLAAEKARARQGHAVVCPAVTGRAKERIVQSKSVLVLVRSPQVISNTSGANLYLPGVFFIVFLRHIIALLWRYVFFFLLCFLSYFCFH